MNRHDSSLCVCQRCAYLKRTALAAVAAAHSKKQRVAKRAARPLLSADYRKEYWKVCASRIPPPMRSAIAAAVRDDGISRKDVAVALGVDRHVIGAVVEAAR